MDERILVEVYVPAAMRSFDVYLPNDKKIKDIKNVLFPLLEELNDGVFISMAETELYGQRIHVTLTDETTLQEAGIVHGDKLLVL